MGETIPGMYLNREIITTKLRSDGTSTTMPPLWRSWTINIALRAGSAVLKGRKRAEYDWHARVRERYHIFAHLQRAYEHTRILCMRIDRFVYPIRMSLSSMLCETIPSKFRSKLHRTEPNKLFAESMYVSQVCILIASFS